MVREGLLRDARRRGRRHRTRRSPRRTASWPVRLHPDQNPGDAAAEERFKEVSAAYDVLGDEAKRKEYDEVRRLGPMAGGFGGRRPRRLLVQRRRHAGRRPRRPARPDVRRGGGRGGRARRRASARNVAPTSTRPAHPRLRRRRHRPHDHAATSRATRSARRASGSGAKPGTHPTVCAVCGGRGVVDDNQGIFSFSSPCRNCQGRGLGHHRSVPHVPRHRRRATPARGQGADPRRRHRRPDDPARRAWRAGSQRWPGRRSAGRDQRAGRTNASADRATTSPSRSRSRSPRRRSAATSTCPTLDGSTVKLRLKPGTPERVAAPRQGQGHHHHVQTRGQQVRRPDRHGRRRRPDRAHRRPTRRRSSSSPQRLRWTRGVTTS